MVRAFLHTTPPATTRHAARSGRSRLRKTVSPRRRKKKIGSSLLARPHLKRVETTTRAQRWGRHRRRRCARAPERGRPGGQGGRSWGHCTAPNDHHESFDVAAGFPDDLGDPAFSATPSPNPTSPVAQRMIDAGVTLFGKTNVPLEPRRPAAIQRNLRPDQQLWDLSGLPGGSSAVGRGVGRWPDRHQAGSELSAPRSATRRTIAACSHKPTWGVVSPVGALVATPWPIPDINARVAGARRRGSRRSRSTPWPGPDEIDGRGWTRLPATHEEDPVARLFRWSPCC